MPDIKNTTRAQTLFLRAFRKHPDGPPPEKWPSPVVLRRWIRRRGFCKAMNSILRALRYQADFQLTAAAASGAGLLHAAIHGGDVVQAARHIDALVHLLRLNHIRQRFAEPLPQPESIDIIKFLRKMHPQATLAQALEYIAAEAKPYAKDDPGYENSLWLLRNGIVPAPSPWSRDVRHDDSDSAADTDGQEDEADEAGETDEEDQGGVTFLHPPTGTDDGDDDR